MRIWSLHPSYLDAKGLVACWRETLLAQKVLAGGTKGYRNHPQLLRFREADEPLAAIGAYLAGLVEQADARGYRFNRDLILQPASPVLALLPVTSGQLAYELSHLRTKLAARSPADLERLPASAEAVLTHPLFAVVPGEIASWETVGP